MIKYLKELFSEVGTASIARVAFLMCYFTANIISIYSVLKNIDSVSLVATLLSAGTILKIGQKHIENKDIDNILK